MAYMRVADSVSSFRLSHCGTGCGAVSLRSVWYRSVSSGPRGFSLAFTDVAPDDLLADVTNIRRSVDTDLEPREGRGPTALRREPGTLWRSPGAVASVSSGLIRRCTPRPLGFSCFASVF
jgi:hypothetical protein